MITLAKDLNSPPELYTLYDYFASLIDSPRNFKEALMSFTKNEGYSLDYNYCEFSQQMHPLEEDYFEDGVRFAIDVPHAYESEIIVAFETFFTHLIKICDYYLKMHPEDSQEVKRLLEIIHSNLDIT